jgi:hypothetical protein
LTSSEYASRILFTQERRSKVYDADEARDLLISGCLFYPTGIAFTFCRHFTAGRVFDVDKHDKKKGDIRGNLQLSDKIKALQLQENCGLST